MLQTTLNLYTRLKTRISPIYTITCFLLLASASAYAQKTISGVVKDNAEELPGVSVYVKGNPSSGTTTDFNGKYTVSASEEDILVFSYIGYKTQERPVAGFSVLNVTLEAEKTTLQDVLVIGSRVAGRSVDDTPVPIDVLDLQELNIAAPQVNLNQMLNYVAPSFTSTTQSVSDGTDHVDPATLRGMGPDQVLVLINGKRRHASALLNINSTVGRGNVGIDLNAIPAYAIKRIEVLRDGAAAQYGSDAIAGVINIVLKDEKGFSSSVNVGTQATPNANDFTGGIDGTDVQVNASYGASLGKKGGFINVTGSFYNREGTNRAEPFSGSIYHAYNAVEYQASQDGFDISRLRNDVTNIKKYAAEVPYFNNLLQSEIAAATDIAGLQGALSENGNPLNVTDQELNVRGKTREDFNMWIGQSQLRSRKLMANMSLPLGENFEFYAFGGLSNRDGLAGGFYRRPDQSRAPSEVYPDGFLPQIRSDVNDASIAAGVRGKYNEWSIDLSNTWGSNSFALSVENSANTTLGIRTPTQVGVGTTIFSQNTTNLDISRYYKDILSGFNFAFGLEHRYENYKLIAGEEASYASYDTTGLVNPFNTTNATDFYGRSRPGGIQVFPGYQPANERDASRSSVAAYIDVEANVIESVLVAAAIRFEDYSDFGSTLNFKLASRWRIKDWISVRVAGNTGFRAPSLHQLNFNAVATQFISGVPFEVGTFSNDSRIASLLGINKLKNETSYSFSGGITGNVPNTGLKITVDGYFIHVDDRVILTGNFARPTLTATSTDGQRELATIFDRAGANRARFLANAINTETTGVDVVVTYDVDFNDQTTFSNSLALSLYATRQVGEIKASPQLAAAGLTDTYFGETDRVFLESAMPQQKVNLSHTLKWKKWSFFLRNVYFGSVTNPNPLEVAEDGYDIGDRPTYGGKVLTDLSIGYDFNKYLNLTIGSNNLLDIYPDRSQASFTSGNQFIYPRATSQFGFNGRYVFVRANIKI